jgi:hypothetical protein
MEFDIVSLREDPKADLANELSEMNCKIQCLSSIGHLVSVHPDLSIYIVTKDLSESPFETPNPK